MIVRNYDFNRVQWTTGMLGGRWACSTLRGKACAEIDCMHHSVCLLKGMRGDHLQYPCVLRRPARN